MGRFVDQFFYQINGLSPHEGDFGPPSLVFLHGVMGSAMNWRRIAREFEATHRVLLYDSRGHGRSTHADLKTEPNAYSSEAMATDLKNILADLGWRSTKIVGHSMGGRVAAAFAAKFPEKVEKMVIVDIGPEMSPITASTALDFLNRIPRQFGSKAEARRWFTDEFLKEFPESSQAIGEWLFTNISGDEKGATWRFHFDGALDAIKFGRTGDQTADFNAIKAPCLLIRGEFSKDLTRESYQKILNSNPNIKGVEINGAGHWVHADRPTEFTSTLRSFL